MKEVEERYQASLKAKEKEISSLKAKLKEEEEKAKTIVMKCSKEVKDLSDELEQERKVAKEGILELSEMNRQQEKMFSTSIKEIEAVMNQLIQEKRNKSAISMKRVFDKGGPDKILHSREESDFNFDPFPSHHLSLPVNDPENP